ncbi:rod shape-determining protein MreD [Halothiobacillus sp. DCM-1]|uniref:rod shape-determining protein MreD n=1 Tax=Halothiobacillus sp. DCM-1 TaxID=3112558 RepID=UPI003243841F
MRGDWLAISTSLLLALLLTLLPFGGWYGQYAPQWLWLVVMYWVLKTPNQIGLVTAWSMGLLLDVATVGLLGAHALLFTLSAALVLALRPWLNSTGPLQQAIFFSGLSLLYLLFLLWMQGGLSGGLAVLSYFGRSLSNLVIWPVLLFSLYQLRQRLH